MPSGEARGSVWSWNIDFDSLAGTYSGSVTNLGGGFAAFFNGNLDASSTSVGSFAVINSSAGGNQNLVFDIPKFSINPAREPSTLALSVVSGVAALFITRRRR